MTVTLHFEDGTTATRTLDLMPRSRTNVQVSADFPEAIGRKFGAVVRGLARHFRCAAAARRRARDVYERRRRALVWRHERDGDARSLTPLTHGFIDFTPQGLSDNEMPVAFVPPENDTPP